MPDASESSTKKDFIREIIAADLTSNKHDSIVTRFPPEPNGYLHIGHAKSICLNFGLAQEYQSRGAHCNLRFDDTNPSKEEVEFVESIKEDVRWLGFDWGEEAYFASDYFEYFYDCAVVLIEKGLAYVDQQSAEQIRDHRGSLTVPGTESPYRERTVEENLEQFAKMRAGEFADGKAVLRAKIDMASANVVMRDPVLYRVMHATHHHTGDKWCIYPMYDFAHPLGDAKEEVTHSLCTLEFEIHRPIYEWVIEHCPVKATPRQIEFSRLNLTYTVMSKRKLLTLVKDQHVSGWDDPRMPTISGIRRRGYPAAAVRQFCTGLGITKFKGTTDFALLEHAVRDSLNSEAPRRMAVLEPLKLVIENWNEGGSLPLSLPNNPADPLAGVREIQLSKEIWIEADDFMEDPPKKFFRLGPDRYVRLRGGPIIRCIGYDKNDEGEVSLLRCEMLPETIGNDAPEGVKCKAAIHWVSAEFGLQAEIRLYDRLFTVENPEGEVEGFVPVLNPDSMKTVKAVVEPSLAEVEQEWVCQFERTGYFVADRYDHQPGERLVFNRTVALRDSWGRKA